MLTWCSTSSGPAPGYVVVMATMGKLTSGNKSMFNLLSAMKPITMVAIAHMVVKTGRSMATSEIFMRGSAAHVRAG